MTTQQQNIQITGMGLSCASGNQPFAMFDAVASNINFSKPDSFLQTPSANEDNFETVITCPIDHLNNCEDPNDRILLNSIIALENAIESAELNMDQDEICNKKCLIYLMIPDTLHGRGDDLELDEWYDIFTDEDSLLAKYVDLESIEIKFEQYSDGATEHLSMLCKKLSEGEWDTIIFGGVDSLIDEFTSDNPNGIITGEGAAFLVLECEQNDTEVETKKPIANIQAYSQKQEPGTGKLVCCTYHGQSKAILVPSSIH